jgi:hypothetical protein
VNGLAGTTGAVSSMRVRDVVDTPIDRYVAWREECLSVHGAYQRWSDAECGDRSLAYMIYLAALEREEHAARIYSAQLESVKRHCT